MRLHHLGTWMAVAAATALALGSTGCVVEDEPAGDLGLDEADGLQIEDDPDPGYLAAPSCPPRIHRYPLVNAYNNGYDASWNTFTCTGHLGNSDFIAGQHLGNDIFAPRGTPVVVAKAGRVINAGYTSIGGNRVSIVDECGWVTYYAHLDSIASGMVVGAQVPTGALVGTLGDTGSAQGTAPHLHFSVYPEGNYNGGVDPFPLLKKYLPTACGSTYRSHMNGKCIDVPSANFVAGQRVKMWDCNGSGAQRWRRVGNVHRTGGDMVGGLCMDVAGGNPANLTPIQLWHCNGATPQAFQYVNKELRSVLAPGKCVDIAGWNSANGAELILWPCTGAANQRWDYINPI